MNSEKATYASISPEPIDATPMVEVTAPATLKEGFTFNASYEGQIFPVVVPAGGVVEGQVLQVPFKPSDTPGASTGTFKDDLFACDRHGCCHPSLLGACFLPLILLGQVMTRLKLDWLARPAPESQWTKTFKIMVYITVFYIVVGTLLSPADPDDAPNFFYQLVSFCYGVLMLYLVTKVRGIVRAQNNIPETRCIGCEDFCCSFWCSCCTVSQLARQTADYDVEDARFFTSDGLSPKTPVVIV